MKLLVAGVMIVAGLIGVSSSENCQCAAIVKPNSVPLAIKYLDSKLDCNDAPFSCKKQCVKIFRPLKRMQWPEICRGISHLEATKIYVYANSCNIGTWIDTAVAFDNLVCCHEGKQYSCSELPPPVKRP